MASHQDAGRAFRGEDRISELPDALRLQILGLLPCRYAIRTGVLSKHWKDLWKQRYSHPTTLKFGRPTIHYEDQMELANEIQHVFISHGTNKIEAFSLYFHPEIWNKNVVTIWIESAIENGAEELHLDFSQGILGSRPTGLLSSWTTKYKLDEDTFRLSTSLIGLSLKFCTLSRSFKCRYFDRLESLSLQGVNFTDAMLTKLLANCRLLQSLEFRECTALRRIRVTSPYSVLKKLTVVHCHSVIEIRIGAPLLGTFHFFGKLPGNFSIGPVPSLLDVIVMSTESDFGESPNNWGYLLVELDQVQVLTLCSSSLHHIFQSGNVVGTNLNNLQELQLRIEKMDNADLLNIYNFFTHINLPQLETLFIELPTSWSDPELNLSIGLVAKEPPQLNLTNLKVVKLNNFKGHVNEILLVGFLLQNAVSLKLIILAFLYKHDAAITDATRLFDHLKGKPKASQDVDMVMLYTSSDDRDLLRPVHSKITPRFYTREPTNWV